MPLKFCANLSYMFQESTSLTERYALAQKAGFKGVECAFPYDYPIDKLVTAKTEAGVEQVLINAYPGNWHDGDRGLAAIPHRKKEFEDSIRRSVDYARRLECRRIHVMSGIVERESPVNLTTFTMNMKYAADYFEDNDVIGVIEPISPSSVPHYFLNTYKKATVVVDNLNSEYLKLQLDVFHLQQICGDLTRNIKKFLPLVGHIQIAQVPNRNEPNAPGEIDYKYILKLLENSEYNGWIGLEYIPKKGTAEGLEWMKQFGYSLGDEQK